MSKHKPIPKKTREMLYEKYNHRCGYCGCELEYKDMQIDHIHSIYAHNDYNNDMTIEELNNISNLIPACRQCNFYKSTMDIENFRNALEITMMNNLRKNFNYRLAIKYGLIHEENKKIKFYFETL